MLGKIFRAITGDKRSPEEVERDRRHKKGWAIACTPGTKAFTVNMEAQLLAQYISHTEGQLLQDGIDHKLSEQEKALALADLDFYKRHYKTSCEELQRLMADHDAARVPDRSDIALPPGRPSSRARAQASG